MRATAAQHTMPCHVICMLWKADGSLHAPASVLRLSDSTGHSPIAHSSVRSFTHLYSLISPTQLPRQRLKDGERTHLSRTHKASQFPKCAQNGSRKR